METLRMDGILVTLAHTSWQDDTYKTGRLYVDGHVSDYITVTWVASTDKWKPSQSS